MSGDPIDHLQSGVPPPDNPVFFIRRWVGRRVDRRLVYQLYLRLLGRMEPGTRGSAISSRRVTVLSDIGFQSGNVEDSPLREFLAMLRHRLVILLTAVVLVPSAALAFSLQQPKEYTATAKLLFRDPQFDQKLFGGSVLGPSRDASREAATNVTLVSLDLIFARAAEDLRRAGITATEVRDQAEVVPAGQADVVAIEARDASPTFAARIADTIAKEYIRFRREADRSKMTEAITLVRGQLDALTPAQRAGEQGQSVIQRINQLEILASLQTGNAELVQPALTPKAPSSPKPVQAVLFGLTGGLLLGIGLATLAQRLDRRLRSGSDAEAILHRPVLGVIPESRTLQKGGPHLSLGGPEAEAFRAVRTNLRYFAIDQNVRSLLVTSAVPGEGKSTTARYLAATAAVSGTRVVLLEADLRRPTLQRLFVTVYGHGLTDVLAGRASVSDVIQQLPIKGVGLPDDDQPTLDLIVSGPVPPNPTDLLESERMGDLLRELESRYDLIIVDSSPITIVPDAISILGRVSGVAVIVRMGKSTKPTVRKLRKQFDNLAVSPLGVIVNGAATAGEDAYYGYYGPGPDGVGKKGQDAETRQHLGV